MCSRRGRALVRAQGGSALSTQSQEDADRKSAGCVSCHTDHRRQDDAHRGLGASGLHRLPRRRRRRYEWRAAPARRNTTRRSGEPTCCPGNREVFRSSANPERAYTALLDESLDYVRFVNPGDLRAAPAACGPCHAAEVKNVSKSMMTHSGMLYAAALYNNGVLPGKDPIVGRELRPRREAAHAQDDPSPDPGGDGEEGRRAALVPFPRWELGPVGNPYRVFERGGQARLEVGLPDPFEEPGKPDKGLSPRGTGTLNRTDPVILGAQKTRLVDPADVAAGHERPPRRLPVQRVQRLPRGLRQRPRALELGRLRRRGQPGIHPERRLHDPQEGGGHPLKHVFTRSIPSSQCITCHMHPGTNMVTTYLGYTWWDNEVDGQAMYPKEQRKLTQRQAGRAPAGQPRGRGLARQSGPTASFLSDLSTLNPQLKNTQFADFHGHGWVYRAVFKKDRKGTLLDAAGQAGGPPKTPRSSGRPST